MEEWAIFVAGAFFLVTISTAMARLGKGWGGQAWAGAWAWKHCSLSARRKSSHDDRYRISRLGANP